MFFLTIKRILLITIIQDLFVFSITIGGVIWDKNIGAFVPIFSIHPYWIVHQEVLSKKQKIETHNFYKEIIQFSYFEEENLVSFSDNDTKISGCVAEIWNLLAEYLNFTLKIIRSNETFPVGPHTVNEQGINIYQGLFGLLQKNKIDVVPKVEIFSGRLAAAHFTPPLWITRQRFYIRLEPKLISDWVIHLFEWNVWYFILATYLLFTAFGYISQLIICYYIKIKQRAILIDHCFYNFGMLCKQGCIPEEFEGRSRMIELSFNLFCTIIHIAFSVLVFTYMSEKLLNIPFEDLESLKNTTNYKIVIANGSIPYLSFKGKTGVILREFHNDGRLLIVNTDTEMYEKACFNNYVMFYSEDIHCSKSTHICQLTPIGKDYYQTWVASAINKKVKYKRTIDIGVLKLLEFGLINRQRKRLEANMLMDLDLQQPVAVEMITVSMFFTMLSIATVLASIIFVIENLIFVTNLRRSRLNIKNKIGTM